MGELANLALLAQTSTAVAGGANAVMQSQAIRQQGSYASAVATNNQQLALMEAEDARKRGGVASSRLLRDAGRLMGTQRAKFAAQGVDPNSGSAAEVQADTAAMAAADAEMIMNNAYREGWGHRVEAANHAQSGRMARIAANNEAKATLITGGLGFGRDMLYGAQLYEHYRDKSDKTTYVKPPAGKHMSDPRNR